MAEIGLIVWRVTMISLATGILVGLLKAIRLLEGQLFVLSGGCL